MPVACTRCPGQGRDGSGAAVRSRPAPCHRQGIGPHRLEALAIVNHDGGADDAVPPPARGGPTRTRDRHGAGRAARRSGPETRRAGGSWRRRGGDIAGPGARGDASDPALRGAARASCQIELQGGPGARGPSTPRRKAHGDAPARRPGALTPWHAESTEPPLRGRSCVATGILLPTGASCAPPVPTLPPPNPCAHPSATAGKAFDIVSRVRAAEKGTAVPMSPRGRASGNLRIR